MGTCLASCDLKNNQQAAQYSPTAFRPQIEANLAEKTSTQTSLKRFRQEGKPEHSEKDQPLEILEESTQKAKPGPAPERLSSLCISESDGSMSKRAVKPVVLPSLKELTNGSSLYERTERHSNSGDDSQSEEEKSENSLSNASADEPRIQTPFTREELKDMRGLGATETDNRLIELTVNAHGPLRLSSVKFANGSVYSGEWLAGKRQGQGTLIWADGSRYDGQWLENCSWGFGRLAYSDRDAYEGEFVRNCREGKGRMTSGESTYEGDWRNDRQEGRGIERWNGGRYEGEWLAGHKSGKGQIYFEDGSYYKGDFHGNEIHGEGCYYWQGSRKYEGRWQHNRMCGKGVLIWKNGQRHQGLFKNDKLHGEGVIYHADGSSSHGVFQLGKKHGHFIEIDVEGKSREIDYFMGKRMKQAEEHCQSNTSNTFRSVSQSV